MAVNEYPASIQCPICQRGERCPENERLTNRIIGGLQRVGEQGQRERPEPVLFHHPEDPLIKRYKEIYPDPLTVGKRRGPRL
jgi:hypothetical protein